MSKNGRIGAEIYMLPSLLVGSYKFLVTSERSRLYRPTAMFVGSIRHQILGFHSFPPFPVNGFVPDDVYRSGAKIEPMSASIASWLPFLY